MPTLEQIYNRLHTDFSGIIKDDNFWNPSDVTPNDLIFLIEIKGGLITIRDRIAKRKHANKGEQQGENNEQERIG